MTSLKVAALALVAMLAVGCSGAVTTTPKSSPTVPTPLPSPIRPQSFSCTTSAAQGGCGPYKGYSGISPTSDTQTPSIGNNVWDPVAGWHQSLYANSPGDWEVISNIPTGNTSVVSYPSTGADYAAPKGVDQPTPLTNFSSIYSSFSENMHVNSATDAWAAYDVWLGIDRCDPSRSTCPSHEVMIQHDFSPAANPQCPHVATTKFGGSNGVPVQGWGLCKLGSELIWQLPVSANEQSGSVDILAMLTWLTSHGYLPSDSALWSIGYGWEICSTGGADENFQVKSFSITPRLSTRGQAA
jgi:hypothetical protein